LPQPHPSNLRILVVDDHQMIREFVKRALIDNGCNQIQFAKDGNEAIDAIDASLRDQHLYDMVFLDWHMPGRAGIDVLAFIRSFPHYSHATVVMFTAEFDHANMKKAIKMGATSYILKPISADHLSKKIADLIDRLGARSTNH
jgi:two-component system chemotaxis response regulator CheY